MTSHTSSHSPQVENSSPSSYSLSKQLATHVRLLLTQAMTSSTSTAASPSFLVRSSASCALRRSRALQGRGRAWVLLSNSLLHNKCKSAGQAGGALRLAPLPRPAGEREATPLFPLTKMQNLPRPSVALRPAGERKATWMHHTRKICISPPPPTAQPGSAAGHTHACTHVARQPAGSSTRAVCRLCCPPSPAPSSFMTPLAGPADTPYHPFRLPHAGPSPAHSPHTLPPSDIQGNTQGSTKNALLTASRAPPAPPPEPPWPPPPALPAPPCWAQRAPPAPP